MIKSFKNEKNLIQLFSGILIQVVMPIIYVLICNIMSSGNSVNLYTEEEFLKIFNKNNNVTDSLIIDVIDVDVSMNCNEADGCPVWLGNYELGEGYSSVASEKGAKIYTIKTKDNYYIIGNFIGSFGLKSKNIYEPLEQYTTEEYKILMEVDKIAESFGYIKNENGISYSDEEIFIETVINKLETLHNVSAVNLKEYGMYLDITLKKANEDFTIDLYRYFF